MGAARWRPALPLDIFQPNNFVFSLLSNSDFFKIYLIFPLKDVLGYFNSWFFEIHIIFQSWYDILAKTAIKYFATQQFCILSPQQFRILLFRVKGLGESFHKHRCLLAVCLSYYSMQSFFILFSFNSIFSPSCGQGLRSFFP